MTEERNGLSELPKGWVRTRLEDCIDILDSQRVPVNASERGTRIAGKSRHELYPYYGATGQVGWIDDYLFDEELVLLGEDGAPFLKGTRNKAYIIKGKSWVNNHAHVLRALFGITTNSFLCHYLNVFDYHDYVTGTTRLKLNQSRMRKISVPLPPLPEQQRIVAKIEELFTQLDAGVAALEKAKAQLRRYRQAVLKAAVEGELTREWREAHREEIEPASGLLERILEERQAKWEAEHPGKRYKPSIPPDTEHSPELPDSWVWTTLAGVAEIVLGQSPPSSTYNEDGIGLPFYQGKAEFGSTYPTPRKWCTAPKKIAEKGDVLISVRAPVGPTNICPEESCIGRGLAAIRGLEGIQPLFILYLMRSFENVLAGKGTGTTFKAITGNQLRGFVIPLPSLAEQHRIVAEVEQRLSVADEMEKAVEQSLKRAERLRQSILKRAFEGKLAPQDPSDEPASVLLERIRAEKARREVERKGKRKGSRRKRRKTEEAEQLRML